MLASESVFAVVNFYDSVQILMINTFKVFLIICASESVFAASC